jgi:dimeric dUTPase (all-alpha-NTP-PPase superfamily)
MQTILENQLELQEAMGWPCGDGPTAYKTNCLAFAVELVEAVQELDWKPWKDKEVDGEALLTELTDALQFWANGSLDLAHIDIEGTSNLLGHTVDLKHVGLDLPDEPNYLPSKSMQRSVASHLVALAGMAEQLGRDAGAGILTPGTVNSHRSLLEGWVNMVAVLGFTTNQVERTLRAKWEVNYERLRHQG